MTNSSRGGFIRTIILIVIVLIILSYYGFDGAAFIKSPKFQHALQATWDTLKLIWTNYLAKPILWIWHTVIVGIIWHKIAEPIAAYIMAWIPKNTPSN